MWPSTLTISFLAVIQITKLQSSEVNNTSIFGTEDDDFLRSIGTESTDDFVRRPGKASLGASCSVPIRKCASVFQCPKLFALYEKGYSMTREEIETLKNHICSRSGGAPNVCCDDYSDTTQRISTVSSTTKPRKSKFAKCGDNIFNLPGSKPRIVGGARPADPGAWPWMAAIYARTGKNGAPRFKCCGSLIGKQWVLTAAHCIPASYSTEELAHVMLGDLDLDNAVTDESDPIEVNIEEVIKHPKYTEKPVLNDVALLRLSTPVEYSHFIQPICLHKGLIYLNDSLSYDNKKPHIAGWGYNSTEEKLLSSHLQEIDIPVVNIVECKKNYAAFSTVVIDGTVMCAGKGVKDACQGDSGGPLMFKDFKTNIWWQAGIVSFGKGCGEIGFPGVYTRVAAFINWIEKKTNLKF